MNLKLLNKRIDENCKSIGLITRPDASPGIWLSFLLPLAYGTSILRHPKSSHTFEYQMTSLAACGLCLQSVNFFLYIIFGGRFFTRLTLSFLPGFVTACLIHIYMQQNTSVSLFWGLSYNLFYQFCFIKLFRKLPKCFTVGEAALSSQGLTLFVFTALLQIPHFIERNPTDEFGKMNAIMIEGVFCVLIVAWITSAFTFLRNWFLFFPMLGSFIAVIFFVPVTPNVPIIEIIDFIVADTRRICMITIYAGMLGLSAATVAWQVNKSSKASTAIRKIFHILVVLVFIPGLLYQCTLLYISTGIALCAIILLELMRVAQIYPFDNMLSESFNVFADEKDAGNIALTPFYLLVGCSLPLWISPCVCGVDNNFICPSSLIVLMSGVLTVGIGDSAASIFGSKLGIHKLPYSVKSFEGLIANILLQALTVTQLYSLGLINLDNNQIMITGASIAFVSLVEAYTDQVDNIVLPLLFYILANFI